MVRQPYAKYKNKKTWMKWSVLYRSHKRSVLLPLMAVVPSRTWRKQINAGDSIHIAAD